MSNNIVIALITNCYNAYNMFVHTHTTVHTHINILTMYAYGCTINIHRAHSQREESEKEYALALKSLRVGTHIPRHIHTLMIFVCFPT